MKTLGILVDRAKKEGINLYTIGVWLDGQWEKGVVHPANDCNDLYSVSKNFTATAVGILCDRGQLSLEQSVYSLFHEEYPHCCGEKWKEVTVAHVLEQTVGIGSGFLDIDVEDIYQYDSRDFLEITLSAPFVYRPGEKMVYSDSNYYLASRIAAKAAGERLQDFLARELFLPLGFQGWAWAVCPYGHAMGATGLFIRVEDMLRFGQLYLKKGIYQGNRLLSERWVQSATQSRVLHTGTEHYGLSFWRTGDAAAFHCGGMNGQIIYISPKANRVVAWQAHDPKGECIRLLNWLYELDEK